MYQKKFFSNQKQPEQKVSYLEKVAEDAYKYILDLIFDNNLPLLQERLPLFLACATKEHRQGLMLHASTYLHFDICKLLIQHGIPFVAPDYDVATLSKNKYNSYPLRDYTLNEICIQIDTQRETLAELSNETLGYSPQTGPR